MLEGTVTFICGLLVGFDIALTVFILVNVSKVGGN